MNKSTPIVLNRLSSALTKQGIKLKRMQLLQVAASAFGYRNTHEFNSADEAGDIQPPKARYMGRTPVPNVGWMHFFQDENGVVFAVDQEPLDKMTGQVANWLNSPLGGMLDISDFRNASSSVPALDAPVYSYAEAAANNQVLYLTNGCCEHAHGTPEELDILGLSYDVIDGEFYPLTKEEAEYIAEDIVTSLDGKMHALTGYSVLHRGKKHLMPSIELPVGAAEDAPERDQVLSNATIYADNIRQKVRLMDGHVHIDIGIDDRVIVHILVPFSQAFALGSPEAWQKRLAWLMTDPTVSSDPAALTRMESRNYAVDLEWIGEGQDGDYDPMDPDDIPLLRFDVQRRVDGKWEDVDNASYCTQVPAWASPEGKRLVLSYLIDRLERDGSSSIKRLCETLSWTTVDLARSHAQQMADVAKEAPAHDLTGDDEEYVAHETYGDPDQGTSIDLRRRADGSVRCEVYVDLSCADVFEGKNIDEVRAHLKTLDCDQENAEGPPHPSHALAPQWDGTDPDSVKWVLVPEHEDEPDWFEDAGDVPVEKRFIMIDEMTV